MAFLLGLPFVISALRDAWLAFLNLFRWVWFTFLSYSTLSFYLKPDTSDSYMTRYQYWLCQFGGCTSIALWWTQMAHPLQPRHQCGGQGLNYCSHRLLFPPLSFREARTGNASSTLWASGRNSSPAPSAARLSCCQSLLPVCDQSYYDFSKVVDLFRILKSAGSPFQEVHCNGAVAVWITRYLLGVVLPVMLFAFHKDEILFTQNNACRWLFVGWLLCWYSFGLGLSFKHNVETIRFRQICLSFHICSEGTDLDCFMWADTRVLHFLDSPLWYSHSSSGVLLLSLDLYLHSFRKTPNSLQEMQHWNIFSTVNIPHLIVRVHIVWYLAIERWNVSDFPLPWPMFLFWLNASQQQKWNSVLFRGYTDIDNIF